MPWPSGQLQEDGQPARSFSAAKRPGARACLPTVGVWGAAGIRLVTETRGQALLPSCTKLLSGPLTPAPLLCLQGCPSAMLRKTPTICDPTPAPQHPPPPPHCPVLTQTSPPGTAFLSCLACGSLLYFSIPPPAPSPSEGQLLFFSCRQRAPSVGPPLPLIQFERI